MYRVRHGKLFFFDLGMTHRNIKLRLFSKVDLESWDLRKFAGTTIFYEIHNVCHLQSNLETCKKKLWKKDFECKYCKDISKIKIQCFFGFFDGFPFQPLIKVNCLSNSWFVTCYCLKKASKVGKNSKFTKDQEIFANRIVDGAQYVFHENCFY